MKDLTPTDRTRIYVVAFAAAVLALAAAVVFGVIDLGKAGDIALWIAGVFGLGGTGLAVANRPTITHTERDDAAALRAAAEAAVTLHRAEAPEAEQAAAIDRLGALILR